MAVMPPDEAPGAAARARLVEMRRELIAGLDREIDGGMIALLGSVQAAIEAIDAAARDEDGTGG